jgi:hypothetical protein
MEKGNDNVKVCAQTEINSMSLSQIIIFKFNLPFYAFSQFHIYHTKKVLGLRLKEVLGFRR